MKVACKLQMRNGLRPATSASSFTATRCVPCTSLPECQRTRGDG